MKRLLIGLALLLTPAVAMAQSQVPSIRDIIELSKAGMDEGVLLALIDVHRPVYPVDAETLKKLKAAGVAPAVIVAMVKSGRSEPPPPELPDAVAHPAAPAAAPQVIVVEREAASEPRVREIAVPVPVYVPVWTRSSREHPRLRPEKRAEPVFWGFGGKLRPDAWRPLTAADVQKDAKVPREPQRK